MDCNAFCAKCLMDKRLYDYPQDADPAVAAEYRCRVREIIERDPHETSAEKDYAINLAHDALFGPSHYYDDIKRHFNALMLQLEPEMHAQLEASSDPLRRAVQYAMTGNFIDFAAMDSVDEDKLRQLIAGSADFPVDDGLLEHLRRDILSAKKLAFIHDNCGEIVMDKALMGVIGGMNPNLEITAIVKGGPIVNDVTTEDAEQVKLSAVAHRITDTGCPIAGMPERRISEACRKVLEASDVIISKGQANYETLCECGLNIYYIFMCKCQLFTDRFNVPLFSGLIVRERD